jgi:hypothetical protein
VLGSNLQRESTLITGGMDAQAFRFEGDVDGRTVEIDQAVRRHTGLGGIVRHVAESLAKRDAGGEAVFPGPVAAVCARELARRSRAAVDLGGLSRIGFFGCQVPMAG